MFSLLKSRLRLAGPATAGILAAHWVAYTLTVDAHERTHLLEDTGHRFFPYLSALGIGLLVAALSGWISSRLDPATSRSVRLMSVAGRLSVLQLTGFLALEFGERALFGHGASLSMLAEPPIVAGLLLQLAFAGLAALLLAAVAKVVDLVVARRLPGSAQGETTPTWTVSQIARPRMLLSAGSWTLRGPPAF